MQILFDYVVRTGRHPIDSDQTPSTLHDLSRHCNLYCPTCAHATSHVMNREFRRMKANSVVILFVIFILEGILI